MPAPRAKQFDDKIDSVVRLNGTLIAKARFAQSGFAQPPDATFTLRLSYGAVKGYKENGKHIPYFTTMGGAYEHSAEHNNQPPYNLPDKLVTAKSKLDLSTPLNFVSTADIIGGNSGSPTVNKQGEVMGIIFDGNIESLSGSSPTATCRTALSRWTPAAFRKHCARSTAQRPWPTNSWGPKRGAKAGK